MKFPKSTINRIEACFIAGSAWLNWYVAAQCKIVTYISENLELVESRNRMGVNHFRFVCGLLAIASPRVRVSRSVRIVQTFIETGRPPKTSLSDVNKKLIAFADNPAEWIFTQKVGDFYQALNGNTQSVVIDIHMCRVFGFADGYPMQPGKKPSAIRDDIKKVVSEFDRFESPASTQAAIWSGWMLFNGKQPAYIDFSQGGY